MSVIPQTMRAAVLHDAGDIRIEERPVPALEPGDVLVRMGASGVCSGDLVPWYVRRKAPFVFGHEPAGTVVAAGAGAHAGDEALLGVRVFAHHHVPCLACRACARGRYVQCAHWRTTSLDPGGMAEFFRVPRSNRAELLSLPDEVSFIAGTVVEPLACVVKSLRRGTDAPLHWNGRAPEPSLRGANVYVIGLGVMGLLHVALAAALGADVFGSDFLDERRSLAAQLGARTFPPDRALAALRDATDGEGADLVVCGPATPGALQHAIDAAAGGGTVVLFAPFEPEERFALDQGDAYFRDLRILGSYSCGPDDTAAALRLLSAGTVDVTRLGAVTWPLEHAAAAYGAMQSHAVVKAIVTGERITLSKTL